MAWDRFPSTAASAMPRRRRAQTRRPCTRPTATCGTPIPSTPCARSTPAPTATSEPDGFQRCSWHLRTRRPRVQAPLSGAAPRAGLAHDRRRPHQRRRRARGRLQLLDLGSLQQCAARTSSSSSSCSSSFSASRSGSSSSAIAAAAGADGPTRRLRCRRQRRVPALRGTARV
jgi:hypothetical protein